MWYNVVMSSFRFAIGIVSLLGTLPSTAYARTLSVSSWYAGGITWEEIVNNVFTTLRGTLVFMAAAVFIGGAFYMTLGYKSENQTTGKGMMIGALVGLAIGIAALAIFNTVLYFVYGS